MQTTINGQLLLTMLVEDILLHVPDAQLLQTNTDGATFRFKEEHLPIYDAICKKWEKVTKLTLEFADYKSMYIWDVNCMAPLNKYLVNCWNAKDRESLSQSAAKSEKSERFRDYRKHVQVSTEVSRVHQLGGSARQLITLFGFNNYIAYIAV